MMCITVTPTTHRPPITPRHLTHGTGNGTQEAFWSDSSTLFISIHQDSNYPLRSGYATETGSPAAPLSTVNLPLPPGSGVGAYYYAFDKVVVPALERFKPDIILVSSGFDASYADPLGIADMAYMAASALVMCARLGAMMLSSEAYGKISSILLAAADKLCGGRCLFAHEGGYSKDYVPFCGLAVMESLVGVKSGVVDPSLSEVHSWGYQDLQLHQAAVVDKVARLVGLSAESEEDRVARVVSSILESVSADRRADVLKSVAEKLKK